MAQVKEKAREDCEELGGKGVFLETVAEEGQE